MQSLRRQGLGNTMAEIGAFVSTTIRVPLFLPISPDGGCHLILIMGAGCLRGACGLTLRMHERVRVCVGQHVTVFALNKREPVSVPNVRFAMRAGGRHNASAIRGVSMFSPPCG